jgi:hypothetical protein
MRAFLPLLLLSACTVWEAPSGSVTEPSVTGTVVSVDLAPIAYDGDAVIVMTPPSGESVRVLVPARVNLCQAQGLDVLNTLQPGDEIEVRGDPEGDGALRPCLEPDHLIRRLGSAR